MPGLPSSEATPLKEPLAGEKVVAPSTKRGWNFWTVAGSAVVAVGLLISLLYFTQHQQLRPPEFPSFVMKGERLMSTNFLAALLRQNFGSSACEADDSLCLSNTYCVGKGEPSQTTYCCWKHGYADPECPFSSYQGDGAHPYPTHVFIARTPYSWLLSMYEKPYEYNGCDGGGCGCGAEYVNQSLSYCECGAQGSCGNFSHFLRSQYAYCPYKAGGQNYYCNGEDTSSGTDRHETPVVLWNAKVASATQRWRTPARASAHLSHLQLYNQSEMTRQLLHLAASGEYKLTAAAQESLRTERLLLYPPMSSGEGNDKFSNLWSQEEFNSTKQYEEDNEWLELFTQEDLDFVNAHVDDAIFAYWGFERVWQVQPTLGSGNVSSLGERSSSHSAPRRHAAEVWGDRTRMSYHRRMWSSAISA